MVPERRPAGETGTGTRSEFPAVSLVPALPGSVCAAWLAPTRLLTGASSASASMRRTRALAYGHAFRALLCNLLHLPLEDYISGVSSISCFCLLFLCNPLQPLFTAAQPGLIPLACSVPRSSLVWLWVAFT